MIVSSDAFKNWLEIQWMQTNKYEKKVKKHASEAKKPNIPPTTYG